MVYFFSTGCNHCRENLYDLTVSYSRLNDRESALKEYEILKCLAPQMADKLLGSCRNEFP